MRLAALACLFALALLACLATAARADVSTSTVMSYDDTTKVAQHSAMSLTTSFTYTNGTANQSVRNFSVDTPAGALGDPMSVPEANRCALDYTAATTPDYSTCPASSKVGDVSVSVTGLTGVLGGIPLTLSGSIFFLRNQPTASPEIPGYVGIYISPPTGIPLLSVAGIKLTGKITARNKGDYGLNVKILEDIPNALLSLTALPGAQIKVNALTMRLFKLAPNGSYFATNPTRCTNWVSSTYARSWETNASANADVDPAIAGNDSFASSSTTTPDCTTLPPFNPGASISAAPATTGTPSSITLSLTRPNAPATIVQPHIKQVDITFPEGVEINPALFNDTGDSLCTDAQFNKANPDTPATCPAATAIATITTTLPLMSQPTSGTMYLGTPLDNAGNRYRAFIDLPGKMGIKFEGRVFVDPATGQISATVGDSSVDRSLPQVPYSIIALTTKSGPRAAFINPLTCGDHFGSVKFTPWSGQAPATKTIDLVTDNGASPCFTDATRPFAPTFSMTPTTALADSHDSYDFHIDRPDGDQNIRDVAIDLPVGLIAAPAHAAECSESQLAAAGCPASSKVGTADVASGSGSDDFTLSGEIFNIVPQAGQVAKMAAVVHAIVGPYDLGNVILPLALTVRDDLGVSAASAAIPERIGGVAVRVHSIDVHLVGQAANGSFMRAPSRCGTHTVTARITSTKPETINRNASLTTTGCAALAFSPTFSMSAQADPTDKKGDLPSWKMHLGVPAGDSALSNFKLLFPLGVQSNLGALNGLCSDVNYRAGTCPAASLLGTVRINTPLLSDPLDGKVLLVQAVKPGAVLPRIGLSIDAPFKLRIAGDTNFVNTSQIFSEFSDLPDLPISSLDIDLFGGARGILQFVDAPTCGTLNFTLAGQGGQTTAGAQPFGGAVCADYQSARCASGEFGVRTSGMAKKAGKKARFTASLQMPRRCPAVTAVQIKLPKGSKINKKAARKLVIARIAGKKMKLGSVTVAKTTLLIKSLSGEPIDIRLGSSKGVVKLPACKKGKKCWKRNMTFSALARLSNGADWRSSVALKRSSRLLR